MLPFEIISWAVVRLVLAPEFGRYSKQRESSVLTLSLMGNQSDNNSSNCSTHIIGGLSLTDYIKGNLF